MIVHLCSKSNSDNGKDSFSFDESCKECRAIRDAKMRQICQMLTGKYNQYDLSIANLDEYMRPYLDGYPIIGEV